MEIVPMKRDWGRCLAKGYGEEGTDLRNIIIFYCLLLIVDEITCSLNYKIWKTTGNYTKGKSLSEISISNDKTIRIVGYFPVYFYAYSDKLYMLPTYSI